MRSILAFLAIAFTIATPATSMEHGYFKGGDGIASHINDIAACVDSCIRACFYPCDNEYVSIDPSQKCLPGIRRSFFVVGILGGLAYGVIVVSAPAITIAYYMTVQ